MSPILCVALLYLCKMKKIAAIFLLSLYLFGSTDAYQLLKLPQFISHYRLHRQQNSDLSLSAFLQVHYNNGPLVIDDDFEKDMQLPFKTTECDFSRTVNVIVPVATASLLFKPALSAPEFLTLDQVIPETLSGKSVFQPPRFS